LLYGYNVVKRGPYALSIFGGPKIKVFWKAKNKITFGNFDQKAIAEELYPVSLGLTAGVGVNISRIFFDFRYEQGVTNISKGITYSALNGEGERVSGGVVLHRRSAILSFSLGMMF
jgi:hypothetical protein